MLSNIKRLRTRPLTWFGIYDVPQSTPPPLDLHLGLFILALKVIHRSYNEPIVAVVYDLNIRE